MKRRKDDRYKLLREKLYGLDIYDCDLAEKINRSACYISERSRSLKEYTIEEGAILQKIHLLKEGRL